MKGKMEKPGLGEEAANFRQNEAPPAETSKQSEAVSEKSKPLSPEEENELRTVLRASGLNSGQIESFIEGKRKGN